MSNHKYTTAACLVITAVTLVITILFMMGPKIGLQPVTTDKSADETGTFSDRDLDGSWDESGAVYISLDDIGDSEIESGGAYSLDGDLYIISAGTYVLSGSLTDHQIIVQAKGEKVQLVLNGVTLTNADKPPVYIEKADKVFLTLAENTENQIVLSGALSEAALSEDLDAAVYSAGDLSVNGSGSLKVQASEYHGIKSMDDLIISSGTLTVEAGQNALHGRDSVRICGGTFNLTAGNDGIKANNDNNSKKGYILITDGEFHITAAHDAIQAVTDLTIEGGAFDVIAGDGASDAAGSAVGMPDEPGMNGNTGMPDALDMDEVPDMPDAENMPRMGGEMPDFDTQFESAENTGDDSSDASEETESESDSYKGLKAGNAITITGGSFTLDTWDDGIHSDSSILIQDGTFTIASGDDGIHGGDSVTIEAGIITITTSYEGIEGKNITVSGGTIDLTASDDGFNASDGSSSFDFMDMRGWRGVNDAESGTAKNMERDAVADTGSDGAGHDEAAADSSLPTLHITGGTIHVDADGDGLDSNGDLIIDGGVIYIDGPVNGGNGALDSGTESGGSLVIHGGTILALGSSGMAETFDDTSAQYSFLCNLSNNFTEGEELTITDSQGQVVCSYTIAKSGNSIVFSDPQLVQGETYTVTVGEQTEAITLDSISTGNISGGFGNSGRFGGSDGSNDSGSFGGRGNFSGKDDFDGRDDFGGRDGLEGRNDRGSQENNDMGNDG